MFKENCVCCLESKFKFNMKTLSCGHKVCKICYYKYKSYEPEYGKPINMAMNKCPVCANYLVFKNRRRLSYYLKQNKNIITNNTYVIECRNCINYFPYFMAELNCDENIESLPKYCSLHRQHKTRNTVESSECGIIIDKSSGCDIGKCYCGNNLCLGCGCPLKKSQSHWSCKGNNNACAKYILQNKLTYNYTIQEIDKIKKFLKYTNQKSRHNKPSTHNNHTSEPHETNHIINQNNINDIIILDNRMPINYIIYENYLYRCNPQSTKYAIALYNKYHIRRCRYLRVDSNGT